MRDAILRNYNAARPPAFRSDRLDFDAQAILRVARAARLERLSTVMRASATLIPEAHVELQNQVIERTGEALQALGKLEVLVERGPERVVKRPLPVQQSAEEPPPAPRPKAAPEVDEVEEAWKSWKR